MKNLLVVALTLTVSGAPTEAPAPEKDASPIVTELFMANLVPMEQVPDGAVICGPVAVIGDEIHYRLRAQDVQTGEIKVLEDWRPLLETRIRAGDSSLVTYVTTSSPDGRRARVTLFLHWSAVDCLTRQGLKLYDQWLKAPKKDGPRFPDAAQKT